MNYNKLFKYYGSIPPYKGDKKVIYKLLHSSRRHVIRKVSEKFLLPRYYRKNRNYSSDIADDTIISLTSFPKRFHTLWLVIESLKHQTIRPRKIILYLSLSEVESKERIPSVLLNEEDNIFEIRLRPGKLRAHGKYHFAMIDFPDKNIVTVDDDIIYPPTMLKTLILGHEKFPTSVITNRSAQILIDNESNVKTYTEWKRSFTEIDYIDGFCGYNNMIPMGVCGVLYPPHVLYKDALNFDLAKRLSFLADDLWLYSQIKLFGNKVIKTNFNHSSCIPIEIKGNTTLTSVNVGKNQNDVQFEQLREYYIKTMNIDIIK